MKANDTDVAWEKLMKAVPLKKVQSVEMAVIYTKERELQQGGRAMKELAKVLTPAGWIVVN